MDSMDFLRTQIYEKLQVIADKIEARQIGNLFDEIIEHDKLSLEDIAILQQNRLRKILIFAWENVQFYRDAFSQIGFNPQQYFSMDDFYSLPLITKQMVKEKSKEFVSTNIETLIPRKTGGSTGPKITIYYDPYGLDMTAAVHRRCLSWAGKRVGDPECHFSSLLGEKKPWKDQLREFAKCKILNRKNILLGLMDSTQWKKIFQMLKIDKPKLVQGFPSQAYQLALFAEEQGLQDIPLFEIYESTGETLYKFQREKIQTVLGCEVFDRYGNAEFGVIAHECHLHSGMHIISDTVMVEVVRDEVSGGKPEIVVTGLTNYGMPLIRYRTGDLGEIDNSLCDCGLPYPRLVNMQGRVHDKIELETGQIMSTSMLLDIMDRCGGMDDFQVHYDHGMLQIFIKPDRECNLERMLEVQERIIALANSDKFKISIDLVDHLVLSSSGKFRYISSDTPRINNFVIMSNNSLGQIRDCTEKGAFLKLGNMVLLKGFHEIETHGDYEFVWSKCQSEVIFLQQDLPLEILNLSNVDQTLNICRLLDGATSSLVLLHGWHLYNLGMDSSQAYRFSVEKELAPEYKSGDLRELGFGFRIKLK